MKYPLDYIEALADTLGYEGGYVNHPADKGGPTNFGITQRVYDAFCHSIGKPQTDVRNIMRDEVEAIYYRQYWLASSCHWMPGKLGRAVFDFAVNSGVTRAIKELQGIIGAIPDGKFGNASRAKLNEYIAANGEVALVYSYLRRREVFFNQIVASRPSQRVFLRGWLARVKSQAKKLLGL